MQCHVGRRCRGVGELASAAIQRGKIFADAPGMAEQMTAILSTMTEHPAEATFPGCGATGFEARLWQALCEIPRGETRSYAEVARAVWSTDRGAGRGTNLRGLSGCARRSMPSCDRQRRPLTGYAGKGTQEEAVSMERCAPCDQSRCCPLSEERGCPTSRSFLSARCRIPMLLTSSLSILTTHLALTSVVSHPSFVRETVAFKDALMPVANTV